MYQKHPQQPDPIFFVAKDTEHLPESSFYLGCADISVQEAIKEITSISRREGRIKKIEEIEKDLRYALDLFSKDKVKYTQNQMQGFLRKKYIVNKKIKMLQMKHLKMLFKELIVV